MIEKRSSYRGLQYIIVLDGLGYRCGYVGCPESLNDFYITYYDDLPIQLDCHGGITFSDFVSNFDIHNSPRLWWLGWDYNHMDGLDIESVRKLYGENQVNWIINNLEGYEQLKQYKFYSLDEVEEECKHVIDQIITYEDKKLGL